MPNHFTPTEMGREFDMHRREVITKCMELGVPIFQGRIDKALFQAALDRQKAERALGNTTPGGAH